MTYKAFNKDMKKLKKLHRDADKVYDNLVKMFGGYIFESPLYEAMYSGITYAMNLISEKYGDTSEWLSWYIYENEWGKKKMEAGESGKLKPITNLKDLWELMEIIE